MRKMVLYVLGGAVLAGSPPALAQSGSAVNPPAATGARSDASAAADGLKVGLLVTDEEVVRAARKKALGLEERLRDTYHFYISSEGGIESLEVDGGQRYFIRNWTVLRSPLGEAWGSSGAVQLPDRLVAGLDSAQIPFAVPGTRRSGGIMSSLTGGLETRRKNIALSTFHALSTLFYGVLESRPIR